MRVPSARGLKLTGLLMLFTFGSSLMARAQEEKGYTFYERFQGSSNTLGQVLKLDSSVGYNFNKFFGVDVGIPVYFVRSSVNTTTGTSSNNGIGNAYVDLHLTVDNPLVNFASTLTGTAPTGDTATGFSTGRATFDWNNHFDRAFSKLTPFVNLGVANTISDTHFFFRPFTTLGLVGHFEGGTDYKLWHFISAGASIYDDLPSGQQKVFSKLLKGKQMSSSGPRRRGGVFESAHETKGSADIAKDNGFSGWVDANPVPFLDLEVGYTRSVHFALNTVSFGIGFDVAYWTKKARGH